MGLIQRKDCESLDEALGLPQKTMFSFSMKVCGQRQDAEDTMQEVLLKSVPNLPKFDDAKALMVWLYKVAKNCCLMSRRRSNYAPKEDLFLDELMPDRRELQKLSGNPDGTPEASLLRSENTKRLRQAVQKLPAEYRLILVLHPMEELSDGDIAENHRPPAGDNPRAAAPGATLRAQGASKTGPASCAPSDGETR
jgi:RNA polymerase sigma-70 factor (ECF subfamily)